MANWGVLNNKSSIFESTNEEQDKDFDEQDVWGDDFVSKNKRVSKDIKDISSGSFSSSRNLPRNIPRANDPFVKGSSGPMNIPDWSKVYGKNCKNGDVDHGDGDDEDEDGDMVPPHEWIAKKLARNQISSFSVCEGIGRTLKGRDLSKVRNAILTKTGFIE